MGLHWIIFQVCLIVTTCYGLRTLTKQASAFCLKSADGTQVSMMFKMNRNSDPAGQVIPLLPGTETPHTDGCSVTEASGLYSIDLTMPLATTAADVNKCGVVRTINQTTGLTTFSFRLAAVEDKSVPTSEQLMWDDLDRIYNFDCKEWELTPTFVKTDITVSAPGLVQQITPSQIPVMMSIRRQDNNDNITTAEAGTLVYIRLEMTIAANYRVGLDAAAIYAYNTQIARSSLYDDFIMHGADGMLPYKGSTAQTSWENKGKNSSCVNTGNKKMPHAFGSLVGFYRDTTQTTASKWVLRTQPFYSFKWPGSNELHAKTNFWPCFGVIASGSRCIESCQSITRRKRDVNEPGEASTFITVTGDDPRFVITEEFQHTKKADSEAISTVMMVGIIVGVLVLLIICLMIVLFTCMMRRRREKEARQTYNNFSNPPSIVQSDPKK